MCVICVLFPIVKVHNGFDAVALVHIRDICER